MFVTTSACDVCSDEQVAASVCVRHVKFHLDGALLIAPLHCFDNGEITWTVNAAERSVFHFAKIQLNDRIAP